MRVLCLFLCLLGSSLGHAEDFRKVTCRFVSADGNAPPPLQNIGGNGVKVDCTVYTHSISPPTVCFYQGEELKLVSAAEPNLEVKARMPANVKAVILVFVAVAKDARKANTLPWEVFAIEDTVQNFPDGGAFVVSFHQQNIKVTIGENEAVFPGAMAKGCRMKGFPMPTQRNNFNMAPFKVEFLQDGKWRAAGESMLRFVPGMRHLVIACLDTASNRPRLVTFTDFGIPKPAAAPK